MENFLLEYRDPLFGVIVFFALIFVITFITHSLSIFKEKNAREEYKKLLKRFEIGNLEEKDYVHLYKTYNLPFDSIILLASTFIHKGNYNKAISVYLSLLEIVTDRVKKEELLELLGTTYFKSGFMQRSRDIFLKILKFSPRNIKALKYLLIISEKLKEFQKANDIIECLDEIGVDTIKERTFINTLAIINDSVESVESKSEKIYEIFKENPEIQRLIALFFIRNNKEFFWNMLKSSTLKSLLTFCGT